LKVFENEVIKEVIHNTEILRSLISLSVTRATAPKRGEKSRFTFHEEDCGSREVCDVCGV
jgi:hypothetical protein